MRLSMNQENMPIKKEELNEIRLRCNSATNAPWVSYIEGRDHTSGSDFIMTGVGGSRGEDIELNGATVQDQDFIANARQDIPKLLDEIDRLKSILGEPDPTEN